jgi:protein phosphatase
MGEVAMMLASASDVGRKRSHNEDSMVVWAPEDPELRARRGMLLVVSDGMGGSNAGEVASRLTVDTVLEVYRSGNGAEPRDELRNAVEAANRMVHDRGLADPGMTGMGATCTAVVVRGHEAWLAHVGDSRAYLIRNGRIRQLTQDHSLVAQLVQRNQLTPEEARVDPRRNVVTRSVGVADSVEVDSLKLDMDLEPGDTLLICSDGLHGQVADEELARLASDASLDSAAHALIDLANSRGGPDNVTVVLARVGTVAPHAPSGPPERRAPESQPERPSPRRTLVLLALALLALIVTIVAVFWLVGRLSDQTQRLETVGVRVPAASVTLA